jgi:NADH-quinone oxidoreductase subunit G
MTVTANPPTGAAGPEQPTSPAGLVTLTIDDVEVSVPEGTLVIRAAEQIGITIPRFCDHPLLEPAGACRQCLVDVAAPAPDGSLRPMPKPQTSCTLEATAGMVVRTQHTSSVIAKAQRGVMELLLINHPLDCPICDKGGECPLQNQAMANGQATSRFTETKRTFPKPISLSTQILLDRERCVLCQRCTRFVDQIAGDHFIDLQQRGARQQIGRFSPGTLGFAGEASPPARQSKLDVSGLPFSSYFSGNTVQICPVGALTGTAYRFRARPFDLVTTPGVCEHCASGCALRVDHRRGVVTRRLAREDPLVNEAWNCDKGRWAFTHATGPDRITRPLVRDAGTGELVAVSWPEALEAVARGLAAATAAGGAGVLAGGRVTVEDAYAYGKFARTVLSTNDVDVRARPHSAEEADFLAHAVAASSMGVTYADLETAPAVLLVSLEPEEESPIVFLRLRKAVRRGTLTVHSIAPWATPGLIKLAGRLVPAAPGTEADVARAVGGARAEVADLAADLARPGAVILAGERAAETPGTLSALVDLARATGAALAWVPRRAGERGAVEAGALPGLLPGGRPATSAPARADAAALWSLDAVPERQGRDTAGMLAAAAAGELSALVVGGVDPADLPDPAAALAALDAVGFLVSLELRVSAVTERADVVLPVASVSQKAGTFITWEGRPRPFPAALTSNALSDYRVLDMISDELDRPLHLRTVEQARAELAAFGVWDGERAPAPRVAPGRALSPAKGQAVLATWHLLLDSGRSQDNEPHLAGTARRAVARISPATAAEIGLPPGGRLTVSSDNGAVTLPAETAAMPDRVVWLPTNSTGSSVRETLRVASGAIVTLAPADTSTEKGA